MKAIGGFFELELPHDSTAYHPDALALTNGRACLRHVLQTVRPIRVWLPYYTCDAILEPVKALEIPYTFYSLDAHLEPPAHLELDDREVVIAVNYFGLKTATMRALAVRFADRLIVDDTQAFFERGYPTAWSFNSARKFFGVPDGAYLYAPTPIAVIDERNEAPAWDHLIGRLLGDQEGAYRAFAASEAALTSEVKAISVGAERLLSAVDYQKAIDRRRANFLAYQAALSGENRLDLSLEDQVPLCYPLLPRRPLDARRLHAQGIYTATFWKDCLARGDQRYTWEHELSTSLVPLPLDHRYETSDIARVIAAVYDAWEA